MHTASFFSHMVGELCWLQSPRMTLQCLPPSRPSQACALLGTFLNILKHNGWLGHVYELGS